MSAIVDLTAAQAADAVRRGELEAEDVWTTYRERAEADALNSYVWVTPEDPQPVVDAEAPLAELMDYATDLRALTQGRGSFELEFLRYEEVPAHLQQKIVAEATAEEAVSA